MNIVFLSLVAVGFIVLICGLLTRRVSKKHEYYIKNAKRVLCRLGEIENDGAKINYLKKINPYVFEELVLTVYEGNGYKIKRNKSYSGDGGIDGMVFKYGKKHLVQSKRYYGYVKKKHIADLSELVTRKRAYGGIFIHTGKTGSGNIKRYENVEIISGDKLIRMIDNITLNNNGN